MRTLLFSLLLLLVAGSTFSQKPDEYHIEVRSTPSSPLYMVPSKDAEFSFSIPDTASYRKMLGDSIEAVRTSLVRPGKLRAKLLSVQDPLDASKTMNILEVYRSGKRIIHAQVTPLIVATKDYSWILKGHSAGSIYPTTVWKDDMVVIILNPLTEVLDISIVRGGGSVRHHYQYGKREYIDYDACEKALGSWVNQ